MKKAIAFILLIALLLAGCVDGQAASSLPDTKSIEDISSAPSSTVSTAASSEPESSSEISSEPVTSSASDVPLSNDELLEQLKSGDVSNVLVEGKYPDEEAFKNYCTDVGKYGYDEWLQYDINHDGLDDLVLREQEEIDGKKRVISIFSVENGKIRCHWWDGSSSPHYYFVAPNGNIVYFGTSFGVANCASYYLYNYDTEWNRHTVYGLAFYDIIDPGSTGSWGIENPEQNKKGNHYLEITMQTAENGTEIENKEWITKEQFFESFLEMTGASFYDMIPAGIKLRDEVK